MTLAICFSRGSFSKQLLLTCWSFDLLGAFALNVNVDRNAGSVFQGYCLSLDCFFIFFPDFSHLQKEFNSYVIPASAIHINYCQSSRVSVINGKIKRKARPWGIMRHCEEDYKLLKPPVKAARPCSSCSPVTFLPPWQFYAFSLWCVNPLPSYRSRSSDGWSCYNCILLILALVWRL